MGQGLGACMD